jgi:translation initiation factor 4E
MASTTSVPVVNENQEIAQPTATTPVVESSDNLNVPSAEGVNQGGDFAVKHPLHHAWTFWYDTPGKKKNQQSWGKSLKELITVTSVEDFWG